jgi:hypothetical protein
MSDCIIHGGELRGEDGRAKTDRRYAYRIAWEDERGPLGGGLVLHHLCGNPACVNVEHLEPMTQSAHAKVHGRGGDWGEAAKTHCPSGHPYDEENTYRWRNERHCRICRRAASARYKERVS